jgi:hypothetical protein
LTATNTYLILNNLQVPLIVRGDLVGENGVLAFDVEKIDDGTGPYGTGIAYNPYGTVVAKPESFSPYNYAPTTTLVHEPLVGYGKKAASFIMSQTCIIETDIRSYAYISLKT